MTPQRSDMMPVWTDAYMADTTHLSLEQHGAYFLLLQKAWRNGNASVPDCDMYLRNTLSVTQKKWLTLRPVLVEFFQIVDGRWTQKKLSILWDEREAFLRKQSERSTSSSKKADDNRENGLPKRQTIDTKKPNENNETEATIAVAVAVADYTASTPQGASAKRQSREMEIRDACLHAAGDCIRDTAKPLIRIRDVLLWIEDEKNPCDLHLDVLPAIRDVAARGSPPTDLTSFKYFRAPVMRYRDERLAGNPAPSQPSDRNLTPFTPKVQNDQSTRTANRKPTQQEITAERRARRAAKLSAGADPLHEGPPRPNQPERGEGIQHRIGSS